jgi:hypothetical protein
VKLFVGLMALAGIAAVATSFGSKGRVDLVQFASFAVLAAVSSVCKVKLPGHEGTMSVNLPYILMALAMLPKEEALVVVVLSVLVQYAWTMRKRFNVLQFTFNVAMICVAVRLSEAVFAVGPTGGLVAVSALYLLLAGIVYFAVNTLSTAVVVGLTEKRSPVRVWSDIFMLTFPYYTLGTTIAVVGIVLGQYAGWQMPLAALPLLYATYRSYRMYFRHVARTTEPEMAHAAAV